eukprot:scaffold59389_cov72-Phaeocystis_antarctica.AAC.2
MQEVPMQPMAVAIPRGATRGKQPRPELRPPGLYIAPASADDLFWLGGHIAFPPLGLFCRPLAASELNDAAAAAAAAAAAVPDAATIGLPAAIAPHDEIAAQLVGPKKLEVRKKIGVATPIHIEPGITLGGSARRE